MQLAISSLVIILRIHEYGGKYSYPLVAKRNDFSKLDNIWVLFLFTLSVDANNNADEDNDEESNAGDKDNGDNNDDENEDNGDETSDEGKTY